MRTLIENALLVPMTGKKDAKRGSILIEDGKIARIGTFELDSAADKVIDGSEKIALPGLINAHTHLSMGLMRNYKDSSPNLQQWLSEIFPIEDKLRGEDIYQASRLGLVELIKSGCTFFSDMYFQSENTARAVKEAKMRGALGLTLFGDGKETRRRFRELLPPIMDEIGSYEKLRLDIAPHAIYTCTAETYTLAKEKANELGVILNTHLSETRKEVEDALYSYGKTPLDYLESLGILDENTLLAHAVHLTDEEMELAHERGLSIVHNPSSNAKLASGTLDVPHAIEKGINVSLGTDGASSNNNLNMMEEMHVSALIQTSHNLTPMKLSPYEILQMATVNGAKALHLEEKIGTLEEGKDADIILIRTDRANMTPLNDVYSALIYSTSSEDVDTVFSQGEILMENRVLQTLDESEIIHKVRECWEDILSR